ncbi:hypothetical protein [Arsenophonus nasoniae]|uniref:Uncharacterized protein n=2 Tax=Arsenophonus nasoniae TaxID=638 RepID=A0AA95GG27_9GAMM|nr:hypothetical protein [Arsenophonus nasoniae]WGL96605.1 hypothetical protein QE207_08750 [Arsenophonus nasoniae]
MAGEDTIILNNGYANGGEEQDTYVIERYNPHEYKKNLLWNQSHYLWDADNQEWNYIDEDKKEFNVVVTIDEQQFKDKSIVNLNYKLDEIKNLKLVGNDIHIHFSIVDSQFTTDKDNNIKLILKNAYKNMDNEGLIVNHEYILQTIDGFLLSMDPSQKIKK